MKELLKKLNACQPAREWADDKTIEEIWATCHRGELSGIKSQEKI